MIFSFASTSHRIWTCSDPCRSNLRVEGSENTESRFRKLEQRQAGPWEVVNWGVTQLQLVESLCWLDVWVSWGEGNELVCWVSRQVVLEKDSLT